MHAIIYRKLNLIIISFLFSCLYLTSNAAIDSLPNFKMMESGGNMFSVKEIPKGKPVVIIYFSPECEHCIKLMDQLFPRINELKKAEIVLMSFKPVSELPDFEKRYQTSKYKNIVVGTEGTSYYLRYYYKIQRTPFVAIYDKKYNLVATFEKEPTADEILNKYKNIK